MHGVSSSSPVLWFQSHWIRIRNQHFKWIWIRFRSFYGKKFKKKKMMVSFFANPGTPTNPDPIRIRIQNTGHAPQIQTRWQVRNKISTDMSRLYIVTLYRNIKMLKLKSLPHRAPTTSPWGYPDRYCHACPHLGENMASRTSPSETDRGSLTKRNRL